MANFRHDPHNAPMTFQSAFKHLLLAATAFALVGCSDQVSPTGVLPIAVAAATDSMGPNLATGPDGAVVLSWIEPDGDGHALRYSVLRNSAWGPPRTVSRGDNWFVNWADFPSVVPLSDSLWGAHWLASQPEGGYAYDVNVALSSDGGATWSEPFLPHFDGTPTEHGFVTLFPDSNGVGLVWLDGRKMVNDFDENDVRASGMTLRAATFGLDRTPIRSSLVDDLTCDCCQTDIALTDDGPVAVYRDRTTAEIRDIYVSRREFGEWQPGVAVASDNWDIPACPVNGPVIRANGQTVVVTWFTAANDDPQVKVAWSRDSGRTFSAPIIVASEAARGHVGAELLPDGDLVVSWQRSIGNGGAELVLSRVARSGGISAPYVLAESADLFAFSVPQLARSGDQLIVAWTNSVDDVYSVASASVPVSVLGGVVSQVKQAQAEPIASAFEAHGIEGTLVVASLDGETVHVHNQTRASVQFSPASTFKIPNTLIALDGAVVTSKGSPFVWDGTERGVAAWNQDQTLESAFKVSCVWCYQEIARKVGAESYIRALKELEYGNQDIGEQVDAFWLNGDLKISAVEQIGFLRNMYRYRVSYSREQVDLVKEIMRDDQTDDYTLYGKTGWTGSELAVGWYVGFAESGNDTWLFAMNMRMENAAQAPLRKELTVKALRALNIL